MDYLALPFVLREGYLDRANLLDSITYSIGLILCTRPGTMPFESEYGCGIWEREFSDLYSVNKADVRSSLRNAIDKFEKRLYDVSVSFSSADDKSSHSLGMVVKVTGNYRDGSEEKKFTASYHLG
jgi:phage baseplate assembly protein W